MTESKTNDQPNVVIAAIAGTGAAKWSYISLIFSGFYFFNLIANFNYFSQSEVVISFIIYFAFISLFIRATRADSTNATFPVAAIILLAAAGAAVQPGTNALFGYASYFAGYYFSRTKAFVLLVFNLAAQLSAAFAFDLFSPYFLGPSIAVSASLFLYGVFSRKEYLHVMQQHKSKQQIEQLAAIAERERIARDMHDLLGHSLSSLALKSELAAKLADKGQTDAAKQEITEVAALARETLSEVRFAVTGLKQKGLKGTISKLSKELTSMDFTVTSHIDEIELPAKVESTLIMLCKEWFTNIMRHCQGNSVTLAITRQADKVCLNIGDNGHTEQLQPGNGIEGMRSRVHEHGGDMTIDHQQGTKLAVTIPL